MAQRPRFVEPEIGEALVRDDRALPLGPFAQHSLPIDIEFPAANMRLDVPHGLRAIPDGVIIVSQTQPVLVADQHLWNTEVAYLRVMRTPARARVIFVLHRDAALSSASGGNVNWTETPPDSGGGGVPDPHAPTHSAGASDPVTVTTLAGFPGGTSLFLRADATFQPPPTGGVPASHATTHQPGGADAMAVDAAAATGSLRTLGTGATQAAPGNDARFTDARTPTAHHTTHETGGADAIVALSGGVITTGTVADARLSANVALEDVANVFTQPNAFNNEATVRLKLTLAHTGSPDLLIYSEGQPANARHWRLQSGGSVSLRPFSDDGTTVQSNGLICERNGDVKAAAAIYERGRTAALGEWTLYTPTFGNPGGTWTIGAGLIARYTLIGKVMHIQFNFFDTTVVGATNSLTFSLPAGVTTTPGVRNVFFWSEASAGIGISSNNSATVVTLYKTTYADWSLVAAQLSINGVITLPIA